MTPNKETSFSEKWEKANKIGDNIIEAFRVPQRKAFIDEDTDLITIVESHERLIKLQIFLATILSITTLILLFLQRQHSNPQLYPQHVSKPNFLGSVLPKIAIIDQVGNGTLVKYWIDKNHTLGYDWSLKLPSPKQTSDFSFRIRQNYFAFTENKDVVILAEDGHKDTTIVYSNSSHRKIPNSKYPFKRRIGSTSVKTSKYFWIFDGHEPLQSYHDSSKPWNWLWKGSYLWATEKQKFLRGPSIPKEMPLPIGGSCALSLNRSHVLVLFLTYDLDFKDSYDHFSYGCLAGWTYDFNHWKWSNLHWCIKGFEMEIFTKLSCTAYFTKYYQLLIMIWDLVWDLAITSGHKITIANPDTGDIVQHILLQDNAISKFDAFIAKKLNKIIFFRSCFVSHFTRQAFYGVYQS